MSDKPTAIVYVDGFNLYKGLLEGTDYRWLDLETLFDRLLPNYDVTCVRYFTAPLKVKANPEDPDVPKRQRVYIRALRSLKRVKVYEGTFSVRPSKARRYHAQSRVPWRKHRRRIGRWVPVWKVEEKGSDVNLASHLLWDAFHDAADLFVVVTQDSDLMEPVRMVSNDLQRDVALSFPRGGRSAKLMRCEPKFLLWITKRELSSSQLPSPLQVGGKTLFKPQSW